MSFWRRLFGAPVLPEGCTATLEAEERVLATAAIAGGHLIATDRGLWVDRGEAWRIGWDRVNKAVWDGDALVLTEGESLGTVSAAELLADRAPVRFALREPGRLPRVVRERVTGSIRSSRHHRVPGGGAWFVQRKVPGRDGVVLQVRVDEGADVDEVRALVERLQERLHGSAGEP